MSTKQHFEKEFPGCTSISRIENDRQMKRQIGREIHHLNRTYSAIDTKRVYIRVGDEYEHCPAKPVAEGKVNVFVPSKQRSREIDLNKLRDEGSFGFTTSVIVCGRGVKFASDFGPRLLTVERIANAYYEV